jgi:tetratricopeptide (TPR) repeat protein
MKKIPLILFAILLPVIFSGCGGGTVVVKEATTGEIRKTDARPSEGNITAATEHLKEAKMFYARDKYKQALQHCEKAIEFDNRNWEAYYYLGLCMQKRHEFTQAVDALKKGLILSPDNRLVKSEMHAAIGYCWENLRMFDDARREYNTSLSFNPGNQAARDGQNRIKVEKTLKNWGKDKDIDTEG